MRVVLADVAPVVLRVLDVPASAELAELHDVFRIAVGWPPTPSHEFVAGEVRYGLPDEIIGLLPPGARDERGVRLAELPDRFVYLHDAMQEDWAHDVEVLGPGGQRPGCVYGEGMCPLLDDGHPSGFVLLREVWAERSGGTRVPDWVGEPREFDQGYTDRWVRWMAGAVPESVRLVLGLVADGVKLTPGGRLPRAFVRQVQQRRPRWRAGGADRPAFREEDLPPLHALHHLLREVELLRPREGRLAPTPAAADEMETVRRLRARFPVGTFDTQIMYLSVAGPIIMGRAQRQSELLEMNPAGLRRCWVRHDGRPVTDLDVYQRFDKLEPMLCGLDLIEIDDSRSDPWDHAWRAGPASCRLLPLVTSAAELGARQFGVAAGEGPLVSGPGG